MVASGLPSPAWSRLRAMSSRRRGSPECNIGGRVTRADATSYHSGDGTAAPRRRSMHATSHDPTIQVRGLSKIYPGGVVAVTDVDFDVAPGEVFGLLGPNGAGKSTTIGMLTTTIVPTHGTAKLHGV